MRRTVESKSPSSAYVGQPVLRREDERFLRGRTTFLDDINLPGMAHLAFVRSPFASARVGQVAAEASEALMTLTAEDIRCGGVLPVQTVEGAELASAGHPILAIDEVRYVGQPVAAVVAESRALAVDAAESVQVDYEPLGAVLDPDRATRVLMRWSREAGEVDAAFAKAAHVVKRRFEVPRTAAWPIEGRAAIASYQAEDDLLTVWVSAQDPHRQRAGLAHALNRRQDTIRVIVPDVGGSFGSKGSISPETCAVALCAIALGRPVKWVENRSENLDAALQGRGLAAEIELALDLDGRMLARAGEVAGRPWRVPAARHRITAAHDGDVALGLLFDPGPPCRADGRADQQGSDWADPRGRATRGDLLHRAAGRRGCAAARHRSDRPAPQESHTAWSFPRATAFGHVYDSGDYELCLDLALAETRIERRDRGAITGVGFALHVGRAAGLWERATARIGADGRIEIACGVSPHGQGHDTTLAQIAADALDVAIEDVSLRFGDSDVVPEGIGTFASRSVTMGGGAVLDACREFVSQAERVSGQAWPVDRRLLHSIVGHGRCESPPVFPSGCCSAVVEIDRATGALTVLRIVAVDDAGTIVNPMLAEDQIVGGIVHGLGDSVSEDPSVDDDARSSVGRSVDHAVPVASDVPPIVTRFLEVPSPFGLLGTKGVGESGTLGAFAAIANAVAHALGRHIDPPFGPQRVWQVLSAMETESPD